MHAKYHTRTYPTGTKCRAGCGILPHCHDILLQGLFVRLRASPAPCLDPKVLLMRKNRLIVALFIVLAGNAKADHAPDAGLETMLVTGRETDHALEAEIELIPGGATLIDAEELRERNVSNLADMLRYVPGMWSASHSGNDDIFFSSRGSNLDATNYDMNGIKLLQDGLPVTTADGNNHNRIIDPLSARYATVARGANALQYGASTLGGAIDFITPTAHNSSPGEFFFNNGGDGQTLGRATLSRVFSNGFNGLVTLEGKQWEGFREHNKQERFGLYANAGMEPAHAVTTRFYATYLDNRQELPGSLSRAQVEEDRDQANPSAIGGNFQVDVVTARIANKTVWTLDADRSLEAGLSYEQQELFHPIVDRVMVDFDGPGPLEPVEVFSLLIDTDHENIGSVLNYRHRVDSHDFLVGFTYGTGTVEGAHFRNDGGRKNGVTERIDNEAGSFELYAVDRWQLNNRWMLLLAAQTVTASRDVKTTDADTGAIRNPEEDYSSFNPRAGAIYTVNEDVSLFANISRLYEPPTNFELEDEASGSGAILDAMHGTVVEFGSRGGHSIGQASRWDWDVSLYYAQIRDEILSVEDPNAPGTSLSANVDRTIHAGVEAVFSADLALDTAGVHSIAPLLSMTLNEFSFDNDPVYGDNTLPAAPDYALRGEILYRRADSFFIGPTFDVIGERYADFVNTYKVDAYTLLGLRAGWSGGKWRVFIDVQNLQDEDYIASHGVRDIAGADAEILNPGAPLSAYLGIQVQI